MENIDKIINHITGNAGKECKQEVLYSLKEDGGAKDLFKKVKLAWAFLSTDRKMSDIRVEESYRVLHEKINPQRNSQHLFLKVAAAALILTGISSVAFYIGKHNSGNKNPELRYTTIVADKGQISKVVLPDSSVVWLNSGTALTYDNNFSIINRDLKLTGQAFLEVKRNVNLPLVVSAGKLKVKVLGTRFDVNAYPDNEIIKVALKEGKVELLNSEDKTFDYELNPGELAAYHTQSGGVEIKLIRPENYQEWKEGELIFDDTPMAEVLKGLERKFDVEFVVNSRNVYRSLFNANFKNESLKEILDYIQFTCPIKYRMIKVKGSIKNKVILDNK